MPAVPVTRDAILALLAEEGPMTAAEITEHIGKHRKAIDASINVMRSYGTQYIHITSYRKTRGKSGREAPVYGLGNAQDAKRPTFGTAEDERKAQQRYRDKHRGLIRLRAQKRRHGTVNPFLQLVQQASK
jgi:predicted ArsR family transcriptional regulator